MAFQASVQPAARDTIGGTMYGDGPVAGQPYRATPRLLLVEDEPVDRLQIRKLLRKSGIRTTLDEAGSVAAAQEAISGQEFDCVLLDYRLGDGSGSEVLNSLKEIYADRAPSVVFVTGTGDAELAFTLLKSGAVDVIAKDGLTSAGLKYAVESALSRRSLAPVDENLPPLDPVTQLPGLRRFEEALDAIVGSAMLPVRPAMVCVLEIASLADIVERFEPGAGDDLMRAMVSRLRTVMRINDIAARIGANRFGLIAPDLPGAGVAEAMTARTMNWLRLPYDFLGEYEVDFRMGVAICPYDGDGAAALLRAAEAALLTTRPDGAGSVRFYKAKLGRRMDRRRELTADLASAIARNQMQMFFQPVIDCTTGRIESVTAEMLWQHPVHGPVLADEFLPLAETAGLAGAIGEWALDRSCSALAAWKETPGLPKCCSLSVGHAEISAGDLASRVQTKTEAAGVQPSQVRLRVNAAVLAHNSTIVARALELLLASGIQIEIENYGDPGLPDVDIAKMRGQWLSLSPALVQGATPAERAGAARPSPLQAAAAKAKGLEMRVIAAGIRSAPQLERARSCGADFVKGDFIAPPLSVHELGDGHRLANRSGAGSRRANPSDIP